MNLILIGYRCTGKTSVGRHLAMRSGLSFYDTDELIVHKAARTIPEIVAKQGWQAFREMEKAIIRNLSGVDRGVIALGGGAILDASNVEILKQDGLFVWLFASPETIAARMQKDTAGGAERPSLTGIGSIDETRAVMVEREPLYRRLADLAVDTTGIGLDGVVQSIRGGLVDRFPEAERTMGTPQRNR